MSLKESLIGYPSIEQSWKKYYRKEPLREFDVNQTFNDLLENANINNLNYNAINFMGIAGNSWTYNELFYLRDKLKAAFEQDGLKQDDTVLIATVSGLEEPLCLTALDKIGAVSKWVDITFSAKELEEAINHENCKYVVVFAPVLPELNKIINNTDVKRVLVVEPSQYFRMFKIIRHSISGIKEISAIAEQGKKNPLPSIPKDSRYVKFMDYVNSGKIGYSDVCAKYDKDRPVLKIQSSGTTGKPKIIVHTDYTINNSINKFTYTDLPLYPKEVMLKTAPAWVGYGLINTLGVGLAYGMEVMMTPMLGDDILFKYNQKYDTVFGVPLHYRYLSSHIDEIGCMSRPKALISGGDRIDKNEIILFEKLFSDLKCEAPIINGAGSNEILGAGYVNPVKANKPGTVGIPMYGDVVSIFDPDTIEEKRFNEQGEICIKSEAAFLYYDNDEEKTNHVKRLHPDGTVWIHTNDLGSMDEDGYITLLGRLSRVITVGGFKIAASQIEEVAQCHPAVHEAVSIAVPDEEFGEVPMLYIVLKDKFLSEQNAIIEQINDLCCEHLKERAVPKYCIIIDNMPYTSNNKQDFRKLEQMGKDYVSQLNGKVLEKK